MRQARDEIEIRADAGWEGRLQTKVHKVRGAEYREYHRRTAISPLLGSGHSSWSRRSTLLQLSFLAKV